MLVLLSGHALEAAQWLPRTAVSAPLPNREPCSLASVPVATAKVEDPAGDGCSRFLRDFCANGWRSHPGTRHLTSFECRYPETSDASEPWRMAQAAASDVGLCPDPGVLVWPPGKLTYPQCSAAIVGLSAERGLSFTAHLGASAEAAAASDSLAELQALTDSCPPPQLFRWTPDAVMWPECDEWIRHKCSPGSPCNMGGATPWSSEAAQRSFAEAQNWCAGRGKCPGTLEGRWRPGPLFYPDCSRALAHWCRSRGEDCGRPSAEALTRSRRSEGLRWIHSTSRACPHPDTEFLWPYFEDEPPLGPHEEDQPGASSPRGRTLGVNERATSSTGGRSGGR